MKIQMTAKELEKLLIQQNIIPKGAIVLGTNRSYSVQGGLHIYYDLPKQKLKEGK